MLRICAFAVVVICAEMKFVRNELQLSSYDDKIIVNTVFGTGRSATTDSIGLIGEINSPLDIIFDSTETYLYMSDMAGGGLIRKLSVTSANSLYSVKTVFTGC